jgi:hypothetical protein
MGKRLLRPVLYVVFLSLFVWVMWGLLDVPPLRLLWRYGLPPAGGPTGREVVLHVDGRRVRFVEMAPGYCHVVRKVWTDEGDFLGRLFAPLGLSLGDPPVRSDTYRDEWVEVEEPYWIAPAAYDDPDTP